MDIRDPDKKKFNFDEKTLSPFGDRRYIIAGTHNAMGMGDVAHLVSVLSPNFLKTFEKEIKIASPKNKTEDKSAFEIIYAPVVIHTPNILLNVISLFQSKDILTKLPDWKGETITSDNISSKLSKKEDILEYLQLITKENPHVHIIPMKVDSTAGKAKGFRDYLENTAGGNVLATQIEKACFLPSISAPGGRVETTPMLQSLLGEYGSLSGAKDSITNHYMGFGKNEYGIFMEHPESCMLAPKPEGALSEEQKNLLQEKVKVLASFSDTAYVKNLLGDDKPDDFLKNNLFIPGYFQSKFATAVSICGLAITPEAKKYKSTVFHFNGFDEKLLDKKLLASNGIATIEIVNALGEKKTIDLGKDGFEIEGEPRTLKIMNGYRLNDKDYGKLYKIAQCFAGSSGDNSVTTALSNGLIPINQVRPWKKGFADDFRQLSQKLSEEMKYPESDSLEDTTPDSLINFGKALEVDDKDLPEKSSEIGQHSEVLASTLSADNAIECWKLLIADIQQNHNAVPKIAGFLSQGISYSFLHEFVNKNRYDCAEDIINRFFNNDLNDLTHESDALALCKKALSTNQPKLAAFVCYVSEKKRLNILSELKEDKILNLEKTHPTFEKDYIEFIKKFETPSDPTSELGVQGLFKKRKLESEEPSSLSPTTPPTLKKTSSDDSGGGGG